MLVETAEISDFSTPDVQVSPLRYGLRRPRLIAAVALGLLVAGVTEWALESGSDFKAHGIVGMSDGVINGLSTASREAVEQNSASAVLSKTVLSRATEALRAKGFTIARPGLASLMMVATGLSEATSQNAQMEQMLASAITASRGPAPGTLTIEATDGDARRAASMATAVAEAFVTDQDEAASGLRRMRDTTVASRLQTLNETAEAARRRLAAFGGAGADPAQVQAESALATAQAKARLDAFRTVLASGTPPLGAQAGLPASILPLQNDFLDLKRQLLEAKRTLGDRHTTVIGLDDGMKQAAKLLTAEWKRLTQGAEAEWTLARGREAALSKSETGRDAKSRQALEEAREAVKSADDAVTRFQAARPAPSFDERHYRLIAAAAVPPAPSGLPSLVRLLIDGVAGLLAAGLFMRLGRSKPLEETNAELEVEAAEPISLADETADPVFAHPVLADPLLAEPVFVEPDLVARAAPPVATLRSTTPSRLFKPKRVSMPHAVKPTQSQTSHRLPSTIHTPVKPVVQNGAPASESPRPLEIDDVMREIAQIIARPGCLRTVFIGSTEAGVVTAPMALTVARAAARFGQRVLLIEEPRSRSLLAGFVGLDAEPVVVDVLGELKIAMPAEEAEGVLYLAPAFADAKRLAASLTQQGDVPFLDDVTAGFDLVLIDGGPVDALAPQDWSGVVDASLHVGRFGSEQDVEAFLAATGNGYAGFIGTIAASPAVNANPFDAVRSIAPRFDLPEEDADEPAISRPVTTAFKGQRLRAVPPTSRKPVASEPVRASVRRRVASR